MLKQLVRKEEEEGRGFYAPALLAARAGLLQRLGMQRLGSAGRGYVLGGVGVVTAAVVVVSLLSWLAPDSDRPISDPLEVVAEQVVSLIGVDGETELSSAHEGVVAAGSRIPWAGERLYEIATNRSASAGPAPVSASRPRPNTTAPPMAPREASTNEPSTPQAMREPSRETFPPSPPSSTSTSPSISSTGEAVPPAAEEPPPTPSEPTSPPPTTEAPLPATEEPSTPPAEEPSTPLAEEPLPTTDEPAPPATEESPPVTNRPSLPPTEGPPPTQNQPPLPTNQPPPIILQPPPPPTGTQ